MEMPRLPPGQDTESVGKFDGALLAVRRADTGNEVILNRNLPLLEFRDRRRSGQAGYYFICTWTVRTQLNKQERSAAQEFRHTVLEPSVPRLLTGRTYFVEGSVAGRRDTLSPNQYCNSVLYSKWQAKHPTFVEGG